MKTIIATALLALAGTIGVQAQSSNRHYRAEAGVGFSDVSSSMKGQTIKSDAGFAARLGGAVEFVLSRHAKGEFYLAPGVEYRYTSYSVTEPSIDYGSIGVVDGAPIDLDAIKELLDLLGSNEKVTFSMNRLSIPLSAGYRFLLRGSHAISLETGPVVAYGLFGSKGVYGSEGGVKRFELGWQGSAAYEFSRFSVRLGANYGLTSINKEPEVTTHTSDFFLNFGVRF